MNWMIPASIRNGPPDLYDTAKMTARYASVVVQLTAVFPLVLFWFGAPLAAIHNLILVVVIALSPLLMRLTGRVDIAVHALILAIIVLIMGLSLFMGGLIAPPIPVVLAGPMAAGFLLGARAAAGWTVVLTLIFVAETAAHAMGVTFFNEISADQALFLRGAGLVVISTATLAFMVQFNTVTREALEDVQQANRRTVKMIEQVEATSEALSNSAADLLGDDDDLGDTDVRTGLTQQMMTTASSGRDMLDGVGQSLHGMIGHYGAISDRIANLHKQSGTIVDLVKTIDNISDRLDLMALNTGIEASHVGEAGKRFRLLSDDMRRLAERVSAETARINAALRQIQNHTDAALDASMQGQSLTDDGTAKLEVMSRQFDEMYQLIERTAQASHRMREDTKNQTTAIRRLARVGRAVS